MLDNFVYGEVSRVSPEAPAPVIAVTREEKVIGGAGNVARNIASLGARCIFVGVRGDDEAGALLHAAFSEFKNHIEPHLVVDRSRPTTRKVRFVSEHYSTHLLRADWEVAKPVGHSVESNLIEAATAVLPRVGVVVLSDYAKGTLTPRVIRAVIEAASALGKPVIVDPKASTTMSTVAPRLSRRTKNSVRPVARPRRWTRSQRRQAGLQMISAAVPSLVTLSEEGLMLHVDGEQPIHIPADPVKIRDVSGAGDTVVATLAVMLALGADFEPAARAAKAAASVVVGERARRRYHQRTARATPPRNGVGRRKDHLRLGAAG
jgi:D-beta-D-heptose 7-phosphate kinase/D-beta-D-heptose 1-phosphate adenosyltransferase